MITRADSHIHLFPNGFRGGSFSSRPGVSINDAACYDSLAREHNVVAALVVGYAAEDWCAGNNTYLEEQAPRYDWIRPVAYMPLDATVTVDNLERLQQRGFVGLSMYLYGDDADRLAKVRTETWKWIEEHRWLVSVNSESNAWTRWQPVLEQVPLLRLLVSHLGIPSATGGKQSANSIRQVAELSRFAGAHVKLSGFYALTSPGHDYPHKAVWPVVEQFVDAFSCDRLLWGSDFSPCLDWVTFPQTLDIFGKVPFLSDPDVVKITGGNLLALLEPFASARPASN